MAGRQVEELFPRSERKPGDVVIELDGLSASKSRPGASLTLHRGEVLGIAGLVGAGRTELVRTIFGLDPVKSGSIKVMGISGASSPAARFAQGVGLVSEDRKGEGLATALSIADNLTLSKLRGLGPTGLVLPSRQREVSRKWIDQLSIKTSGPDQSVRDLSGGNQQKVPSRGSLPRGRRLSARRADPRHRRRKQGSDLPISSTSSRSPARRSSWCPAISPSCSVFVTASRSCAAAGSDLPAPCAISPSTRCSWKRQAHEEAAATIVGRPAGGAARRLPHLRLPAARRRSRARSTW